MAKDDRLHRLTIVKNVGPTGTKANGTIAARAGPPRYLGRCISLTALLNKLAN